MKILLGSESRSKLEIVEKFFGGVVGKDFTIVSLAVDSGIPRQPLNEETTVAGSKHRAENAILKNVGPYDFSIGMEGGLCLVDGLYHLVCAVTVIDSNKKSFTGVSGKIPLPKIVSDDVKIGEEFGERIHIFYQKNMKILSGDERVQIEELISREKSFLEALRGAFSQVI